MWSDEFFTDYYEEKFGDWCAHGQPEQRCEECAADRARAADEADETPCLSSAEILDALVAGQTMQDGDA